MNTKYAVHLTEAQRAGTPAAPRAHPAQSEPGRGRAGLVGCRHRRGVGRASRHRGAGAPAVRHRGAAGYLGPHPAGPRVSPQGRWGGRSPVDRRGLWHAPRRPGALDAALAGDRTGALGARRLPLVRDRAAHLKANRLKPWLKEQWCIPPEANAEFVWHMEDVLDVYTRPYDPKRPQVCLDETSKQLVAETRTPVPTAPGQPARYDYEYERCGVCALFMVCEPLRGWREVSVSDHRGMVDFAQVIKHLVDDQYPDAEQIVLVMDNLNTHSPGSLYEVFEPAEAKRLADKLEIHY